MIKSARVLTRVRYVYENLVLFRTSFPNSRAQFVREVPGPIQ